MLARIWKSNGLDLESQISYFRKIMNPCLHQFFCYVISKQNCSLMEGYPSSLPCNPTHFLIKLNSLVFITCHHSHRPNQWSPLNNLMYFNLPNPSLPTILKREESGQARLENTDMYTYMQVGMGQTYLHYCQYCDRG